MDNIIEFKNVSKTFKSKTHALNNVSVAIEKGEFAFIVGASGAGKSTFLKLIMHEETPSEGTITVNGIDVTNLKRKKVPYLRRNMGIVFQDFRLIDKMTVYDNVAFAMRAIGSTPASVKKRVPYILDLVGLSGKLQNRPSELSGGEQQRVSLARALVNNPAIIIADEPTGNIDPEMSYEIIELLSHINDQAKTTVLVVTHERELVKHFNKRVIEIEKGQIVNDTKAPVLTDHFELYETEDSEKPENIEETEKTEADTEKEPVEEDTSENEAVEKEETSENTEPTSDNKESDSEDVTAEDILAALDEKKDSDVDDAFVDEILEEFRKISKSKGGEK